MLNSTRIELGSNSQTVQFNTPSSGMMQRSHSKSFFIRFAKSSAMEGWVFNQDGEQSVLKKKNRYDTYDKIRDITVLQIMVFGDVEYLCEVVDNNDLIEDTIK